MSSTDPRPTQANVGGLLTWASAYGASETLARLKDAIAAAGMTLFAHIDQAAAAAEVGLTLAPTDVLIFGNPKAGTLLMAQQPTIAIDLPLKALVWQDYQGLAWVAFNAPAWLAERHGLSNDAAPIIEAIAQAQTRLAAQAAG